VVSVGERVMANGLLDRLTGGTPETLARPRVTLDFAGGGGGSLLGGLGVPAGLGSAPDLSARLLELTVTRGLAPSVDAATFTLAAAGGEPPAVGDAGSIGLETATARGAFACTVCHVSDRGDGTLRLTATNGSGVLARIRVSQSYVQRRPSEMIEALAGRAGVAVEGGPAGAGLPLYAADDRRTALEHIARLAATAGRVAAFDDAGRLRLIDDGASDEPVVTLRRGESLIDWQLDERLPHAGALIVDGAGTEGGGERWAWLRKEAGPMRNSSGEGDPRRRHAAPWVRSPQAAEDFGAALSRAGARRARAGRLLATAQPSLAPGATFALEGVADGLYLATAVIHRFDLVHGLSTEIRAAPAGVGVLLGIPGGLR
jgi:hypothetical protein